MKRTRNTVLAGLTLLFLGAGAAWAQQGHGPDLERLQAQISPEAYAHLTATLERARVNGVPGDPLVSKALEGVAKRVPEDRILAVVDRLEANLVQARSALEQAGMSSPAGYVISGVASAFERGVPWEAVQSIVGVIREGQPTVVAMHTVADLVGRGLGVDESLGMVVAVLERGGGAREVLALPPALDQLRTRGLSAPDAAREILQSIQAGQVPPGVTGGPALNLPPAGPPGAAAGGRPPELPGAAGNRPQPPVPW